MHRITASCERCRQRESVVTTEETSRQGWWSTDDPATSAKLDVNTVIADGLVAPMPFSGVSSYALSLLQS